MKELIAALIKAQSEFSPIKKNKTNPHFKSRYADLDEVLTAVLPALQNNGILLSQSMDIQEGIQGLSTMLYHVSGESIASFFKLPEEGNPQKLGSLITYARRYSICAILGVTAEEDDDGNGAKPGKPKPLMEQSTDLVKRAGLSQEGIVLLLKSEFNVDHRSKLSDDQHERLIEILFTMVR
jgi:hypothetical protein